MDLMKKLAERLEKFANLHLIELTKYTQNLLYDFITELCLEIRDKPSKMS